MKSLVIVFITLILIIFNKPEWLSDNNYFFEGFIGHEYISILGVIMAITLASLTQVHLHLNKVEEKRGKLLALGSRKEIKDSAIYLILLFSAGIINVGIKPIFPNTEITTAIFNSISILILSFYIVILTDVTMAIFEFKAEITNNDKMN